MNKNLLGYMVGYMIDYQKMDLSLQMENFDCSFALGSIYILDYMMGLDNFE